MRPKRQSTLLTLLNLIALWPAFLGVVGTVVATAGWLLDSPARMRQGFFLMAVPVAGAIFIASFVGLIYAVNVVVISGYKIHQMVRNWFTRIHG
jgi:hypothetical protein